MRRKFYDLHMTGTASLATKAVRRIAALYEVERDILSRPPHERARERQARAEPLLDSLQALLTATLARMPGRAGATWPAPSATR